MGETEKRRIGEVQLKTGFFQAVYHDEKAHEKKYKITVLKGCYPFPRFKACHANGVISPTPRFVPKGQVSTLLVGTFRKTYSLPTYTGCGPDLSCLGDENTLRAIPVFQKLKTFLRSHNEGCGSQGIC